MKKVVLLFASGICAALAFQAKKPIDYVNALVGTAPLDAPKLIGNAPPPGEELYTGMTSPGAVLPHAAAAAWAASSALSTSAASERATSQNGWPVTGVKFSKYRPAEGATHSPPMKFP